MKLKTMAPVRRRRPGRVADRAGPEGEAGRHLEPDRRDGPHLLQDRFPVPIIALSSDHRALRRMALHYGVIPQEMQPPAKIATLVQQVDHLVREQKFAAMGDRIVIVAGSSLGTPGMLNGVVIHTVGGEREERLSAGTPGMVESEERKS